MLAAGSSRQRLARTLNAAYTDGLLSEGTFAHRLDVLLRSPVVDPISVVGDLTFRHRRHALLRFRDGGWILRDLESTNGTRVNGCDVVRCRLEPGDHLMIGDEAFVVD
jgi:FHA domain